MSYATLRHYDITLAFIPTRRERHINKAMRRLRIRASRRRFKQMSRAFIRRITE